MKLRPCIMAVLAVVLVAVVVGTPRGVNVSAGPLPDQDDAPGIIDAELREHLEDHREDVPVFVLLREQSGLDENSYRSRPDLGKEQWRLEAIDRLRSLSRSTQASLLQELMDAGHVAEIERSFWIVNGLNLQLDAEAIHWLAASDHVAQIYLRYEKPADLIATEGRFTRAFEQPAIGPVSLEEVLAHEDLAWNLRRIQADLVWSRLGLIGRGVIIAILDSGVNYRHSDFRHHLWRNDGEIERNDVDDDGNGYIDDIYGFNFANGNSNVADDFFHGTSSASIMVGDGRGGMLTGVAPGAELMILRMYDQMTRHNSSELWRAFQYDAWEALEYAVREGADVVNMSFAWEPAEKPLHAPWRYACTNVVAAGVVMVAGAGNFRGSYPIPGQIRPPASVPAVITTGGVFEDGTVADLSSRGPVTWTDYAPFDDYPLPEGLAQVSVSAPWGYFPIVVFSGRGYQVLAEQRGSSLTSPHVAGVVALMLEDDPELMPDVIRERLERTAIDVGVIGTDPYTGHGLAQAFDAIMHNSMPRPRIVALRYGPGPGTAHAEVLRPGTSVVVEIDVENRSTSHAGTTFVLSSVSDLAMVAGPPVVVAPLEASQTLRFRVSIDASAIPGTMIDLELSMRLEPAGIRTISIELPVWGSDVLLVDNDGGGNYEREWLASLDRLGESYDLLSTWPDLRADLPPLERYRAVVWLAGEQAYAVLTPTQLRVLSDYLDSGGRLVLAGQSVARDLQGTKFLHRLGARFVADVGRPLRLEGAEGSLLAGYEAEFSRYPTLPDLIDAVGPGRMLLHVEEPAGSGVAVATDRSVLLTIEISGITDVLARDELVRRLLAGPAQDDSSPGTRLH